MIKLWKWIKNNPNRAMFLVPIVLVAGISISHVVTWYDIANPINWAIYLSIAIEVGAMTALVAATNRIKGGVWFMFGLVTIIQMIGNIFYCFKEIDETGELFKSWVELTSPIWDMISDSTDTISMKRWLAFLEGGLLPIISLTSLHFFVNYDKLDDKKEKLKEGDEDWPEPNEALTKAANEYKKKVDIIDEQAELEEHVKKEMSKIENEKIEKEIRMSEIIDEQPNLVEEENLEDEITIPLKEKPKQTQSETHIETNSPPTTPGEELNKTWDNIIRNRKHKLGE